MRQRTRQQWSQGRGGQLKRTTAAASATLAALGVMPVVMGQIQFDWPMIPEGIDDLSSYGGGSVIPALGDFDGDGMTDLVFSIRDLGIRIYRNDGAGDFSFMSTVNPDTLRSGKYLQAGDIDFDGDCDLIWASRDDDGAILIEIAINEGGGLNWRHQAVEVSEVTKQLMLGDLDGDGDLDIVRATRSLLSVLDNDGGTFQPERQIYDRTPGDYHFRDVILGDFDGDGDPDIAAIAVTGDYDLTYYYLKVDASDLALLTNDGSGLFGDERRINLKYSGGIAMVPQRVRAADFDGDQDLDFVVIAGQTFSSVKPVEYFIVQNDLQRDEYIVGDVVQFGHDSVYAFDVADVDSDGRIDLIATPLIEGGVYVFPNVGGLLFGEARVFPTAVNIPIVVIAHDFTGDGQIDLLHAGIQTFITILENITPLPNHPRLATTPLIRGEMSQITLTGLEPGERAWLAITNQGWANTLGIPFFGGQTFDLNFPLLGSTEVKADDTGVAILDWLVPLRAPLGPVVLQGAVRRGVEGVDSMKTPFVTTVISD